MGSVNMEININSFPELQLCRLSVKIHGISGWNLFPYNFSKSPGKILPQGVGAGIPHKGALSRWIRNALAVSKSWGFITTA